MVKKKNISRIINIIKADIVFSFSINEKQYILTSYIYLILNNLFLIKCNKQG